MKSSALVFSAATASAAQAIAINGTAMMSSSVNRSLVVEDAFGTEWDSDDEGGKHYGDTFEDEYDLDSVDESKCYMSESSKSCALDQLTKGQQTYIYPPESEDTGCIAGSPYRFEVVPGKEEFRNNVVVFFQGGGGKYHQRIKW